MKPLVEHKPVSGTNVLKRVELQLRTNERSGRPSASINEENIQKVRKVIRSSHRLTVREVAEEAKISKSTCHEILTDNLGMHCVAAKFVPPLLS
jgi:response regulator of citrate/malate metabolism